MTSTSGNADANESTPGSSAWAPRRDGSTQQPETSAATDHTGASGSAESSDPPAGNATQPIQSRLGTEQPATGTQPQPAGTRQSRLAKRALIGLLAGALALLALLVLVNPLSWLRDQIFGTEDPPVAGDVTLLEIKDTAELKVATGTFSVPVYFRAGEQSGIRRRIPDFIDGNSGVAIYQGSVDATIDLRGLTEGDIDADRNRRTLVSRITGAWVPGWRTSCPPTRCSGVSRWTTRGWPPYARPPGNPRWKTTPGATVNNSSPSSATNSGTTRSPWSSRNRRSSGAAAHLPRLLLQAPLRVADRGQQPGPVLGHPGVADIENDAEVLIGRVFGHEHHRGPVHRQVRGVLDLPRVKLVQKPEIDADADTGQRGGGRGADVHPLDLPILDQEYDLFQA